MAAFSAAGQESDDAHAEGRAEEGEDVVSPPVVQLAEAVGEQPGRLNVGDGQQEEGKVGPLKVLRKGEPQSGVRGSDVVHGAVVATDGQACGQFPVRPA